MHADFRIMRLLDDHLMASDCRMEFVIDIEPNTRLAKERIKAMKLWIESFLDGCVAISAGSDIDTTTFEKISNNVMICPDHPHDYLLLLLIHSKMNAIGGGEIIVQQSTLSADSGEGFSNTVSGTTEEWLPSMSEWMGPRHFHDRPWWERSDSSTMDMKPEDDDDLSDIPELGMDLISLVSSKQAAEDKDASGNVAEIIKPVFRPRIITADD